MPCCLHLASVTPDCPWGGLRHLLLRRVFPALEVVRCTPSSLIGCLGPEVEGVVLSGGGLVPDPPEAWLWPSLLRVAKGLPAVWDRVAVPAVPRGHPAIPFRAVSRELNFLSVRDPHEADRLRSAGIAVSVAVAPDALLESSRLFPPSAWERIRQETSVPHAISEPGGLVLIFDQSASIPSPEQLTSLASLVRRSSTTGTLLWLDAGVPACDRAPLQRAAAEDGGSLIRANQFDPAALAALLGGAEAVITSNLDAAWVAMSFGIPVLLVGATTPERRRALEFCGLGDWTCPDWDGAGDRWETLAGSSRELWNVAPGRFRPALDEQAARLREALLDRPRATPDRERAGRLLASVPAEWLDRLRPMCGLLTDSSHPEAGQVEFAALAARTARNIAEFAALEAAERTAAGRPALVEAALPSRSDVAVCVILHDETEDVRRCLSSLVRFTHRDHPIYCFDDASWDPAMHDLLEDFQQRYPQIHVVRSPLRCGFAATANRGFRFHRGDLVLLRGDARVTHGWLTRMMRVACSRPQVATVTALSNHAGPFSALVNHVSNNIPAHLDFDDLARLLEECSDRTRPVVPAGGDSCLYVRRQAVEAAGIFDEENFATGCGQERDFCYRAAKAGLVNLIADNVLVGCRQASSGGGRTEDLFDWIDRTMARLHPGYSEAAGRWVAADPLDPLRDRLRKAVRREQESMLAAAARFRQRASASTTPTILRLIGDTGGGSDLMTRDLTAALSARHPALLLRTSADSWTLHAVEGPRFSRIECHGFARTWHAGMALEEERLAVLVDWMERYSVRMLHVHSLIGCPPEVLRAALDADPARGFVFSLHDYGICCPTVNLVDASGRHCFGDCARHFGDQPDPDCAAIGFWHTGWTGGPLRGEGVRRWRSRFAPLLERAGALISTSRSLCHLVESLFPGLAAKRFRLIPHGRDLEAFGFVEPDPVSDGPVPLAFVGHLTANKGAGLIRRLVALNRERGQPFVFHFFGWIDPACDPGKDSGAVVRHGRFQPGELPARLAMVRPRFALLPSPWPETFSHALTELWASGIPALASDLGAFRERISAHGGGWLLPPHDVEAWWGKLCALRGSHGEWQSRRNEIRRLPRRTVAGMAEDYLRCYAEVLSRTTNPAESAPARIPSPAAPG